MLTPGFLTTLEQIVSPSYVKRDPDALDAYGTDALKQGRRPDVVVLPGTTAAVAAIARLCSAEMVPLTPRGGGTGYTGGAVPVAGGVLLSLERFNRILEIDQANLLAVVEPNVITADLQHAVEQLGLFYPPDPASLNQSVIGGNVAECAGGPRAFKYGTTKRYVLGLEAVLATGEVIRTGGKVVKTVVGYDLTQLLVGSEGTLAIITKIILRLIPKPPARATLRATFADVGRAVSAVARLIRDRVVPAALELIDEECLAAVSAYTGRGLAPAGTGALLLIEVDGLAEAVKQEREAVRRACVDAQSTEVLEAGDEAEREALWQIRREISPSLKLIAARKINHDVVVPTARIPELLEFVRELSRETGLRMPCFGHVGDGNIHVNIMTGNSADELARAREAERRLFERVIALEGSISGEHGIGFAKAAYVPLELSPEVIALSKRLKRAFDPNGILNPGKIFPADA
jgi:glycolate oxidase